MSSFYPAESRRGINFLMFQKGKSTPKEYYRTDGTTGVYFQLGKEDAQEALMIILLS